MSPESFRMLSLAELARLELEQLYRERETTDPDPELWRWSPLEIVEFARMLEVARSLAMDGLRRLTFVELGSGIGTKLYLARYHFGMSEWGYEISKDYIEKARSLNVNTVEWDLREGLPPAVEDADIVYIARPFKSDESNMVNPDAVEIAWEHSVHAALRPGTVLMAAYAAVKPYKWRCYYRRPFRGVWVKPRSGQYQAMVHRNVSGSDPLVPEPSRAG